MEPQNLRPTRKTYKTDIQDRFYAIMAMARLLEARRDDPPSLCRTLSIRWEDMAASHHFGKQGKVVFHGDHGIGHPTTCDLVEASPDSDEMVCEVCKDTAGSKNIIFVPDGGDLSIEGGCRLLSMEELVGRVMDPAFELLRRASPGLAARRLHEEWRLQEKKYRLLCGDKSEGYVTTGLKDSLRCKVMYDEAWKMDKKRRKVDAEVAAAEEEEKEIQAKMRAIEKDLEESAKRSPADLFMLDPQLRELKSGTQANSNWVAHSSTIAGSSTNEERQAQLAENALADAMQSANEQQSVEEPEGLSSPTSPPQSPEYECESGEEDDTTDDSTPPASLLTESHWDEVAFEVFKSGDSDEQETAPGFPPLSPRHYSSYSADYSHSFESDIETVMDAPPTPVLRASDPPPSSEPKPEEQSFPYVSPYPDIPEPSTSSTSTRVDTMDYEEDNTEAHINGFMNQYNTPQIERSPSPEKKEPKSPQALLEAARDRVIDLIREEQSQGYMKDHIAYAKLDHLIYIGGEELSD